MSRETVTAQASRYLSEARLTVEYVRGDAVAASCRGDGAVYRLGHDPRRGWFCDCDARRDCWGPAYALRLALTYAVLDGADAIGEDHLTAGLAVWQYAAASARHVFGDLGGRSDLDRLSAYLADAPSGRTRSDIIALFTRNRTAEQIDALVSELVRQGDVQVETQRTGKQGRPAVRAYWTGAPRDALSDLLASRQACTHDDEGVS